MKKNQKIKPRALELKREVVVHLSDQQMKEVAGGNTSTRKSQCPTLCFT